jgi:hypothetical protein
VVHALRSPPKSSYPLFVGPESRALQLASRSLERLPGIAENDLQPMFLPWRKFLLYIKKHPTFPLAFRYRAGSLVAATVFKAPTITFCDWRIERSGGTYPNHPPEEQRLQYTWYWGLMVILNVCHAHTLSASLGETSSVLDRRCWQLYNTHSPLALLFVQHWKQHGRHATDDEVRAAIAASPLPSTRFTHPDLYLSMPLTPREFAEFAEPESVFATPPLALARAALVEAGVFSPGGDTDRLLDVDFFSAVRFAMQRYTSAERARLYATAFPHFRMEQLDPNFYFHPDRMLIVFTAVCRINLIYDLVGAIVERYGVTVNVGASVLTPAQAGVVPDEPAAPPPPKGKPNPREAREQRRMREFVLSIDAILRESGTFATSGSAPVPPKPAPRVDRYRRIVPEHVRKTMLYPLKEALTSHNGLILHVAGHIAWHDDVLLARVGGAGHMGSWFERLYPWPLRAVGCMQQHDYSMALDDVQFFTEGAEPPGIFLRAVRGAFFDEANMKIGVDAWGIPYADTYETGGDILKETYMTGQNRAFLDWLSSAVMTSMMGMYDHSSTLVPYAWMLSAQQSFAPVDANVIRNAKFFNRYPTLVRLFIREFVLFQLAGNPVLRYHLEDAFPAIYATFGVQALVTTDEVRMLLTSPLRHDRPRYELVVAPLLRASTMQRVKPKSKKKTDETPTEALSVGKRTKRLIQLSHRDMCPVSNVNALADVFAVCQELIAYHRVRASAPYHRQTHRAFFAYVVELYLEQNQMPAHVKRENVRRPLDAHVYRLVPHATRRAMDAYVEENVGWRAPVDLMALSRFGVAEETCALLASMREEFCARVVNKTCTKKIFDLAPLEQFTVYYFCSLVTQTLSYRAVDFNVTAWKASQIQRVADSLDVSPAYVPPHMLDIVFSTRSMTLHVSNAISAMGTKSVAHSYFSDKYHNVMKKFMTRRRQYPDRGLVRLPSVGVVVEFPDKVRSMKDFKRRPKKRNGNGGEGSAHATALRAQKLLWEARNGVVCKKATTHPLHFLDVSYDFYQQKDSNGVMLANMRRHDGDRKSLGSRTAYPDRRSAFVVPDTPTHSRDWVKFDKKIGAVLRSDCCGTHVRYSPAQFAGWARHPFVWCGYCPSPENTERFIPVCAVCGCLTAPAMRDVRVTIYDDRVDSWRQVVVCDQCHFRACDTFPGWVPSHTALCTIAHNRAAYQHLYQ